MNTFFKRIFPAHDYSHNQDFNADGPVQGLGDRAHLRVSKAIFEQEEETLIVNGWLLSHVDQYDVLLTVPGTSIFQAVATGVEPREDVLKRYPGFSERKPGWRVKISAPSLPEGAEAHVVYVDAHGQIKHHRSITIKSKTPVASAADQEDSNRELVIDRCVYSYLRNTTFGKFSFEGTVPETDTPVAFRTNRGRVLAAEDVSLRWVQKGPRAVCEFSFATTGLAGGEAIQAQMGKRFSAFVPIKVGNDSERRQNALAPSVRVSIEEVPGGVALETLLALRAEMIGREQDCRPGHVCYYPPFEDAETYSNHYHRASWYLGGQNDLVRDVVFGQGGEDLPLLEAASDFDTGCLEPGNGFKTVSDPEAYTQALADASVVMVWKPLTKSQVQYLQKIFPGKRILPVATQDTAAAEYGSYCRASWLLLPPERRKEALAQGQAQFTALLQRERDKGKTCAAVFGTGPSIDRALEFDFSNAMSVACNTIIASDELLDHIQPALITAGDAVSHFGVSRYAARYRRDLIRCLQERDAYLLTSAAMGYVVALRHPEIADRVILCDQTYDGINVDLEQVWSLPRFDSTLNIHMLPSATSFADDVFLLGFDGKNPNPEENEDFWAHSQKAHYHDLVESGHNCHPTFALNRAKATAERYHASVEESCSAAECMGKRFYTLLPSFTPALNARPVPAHMLHKDTETGRLAVGRAVPTEVTGKRALIVMKSPRAHFSGGRYHATMLALAMAGFCDEVVIWSNNYSPWLNELALVSNVEKLSFVVNDFWAEPEGAFDYVVMVPDLADEVVIQALQIAKRNGAKTGFINFESPNWFNAMSPEPRPLDGFRNWYAMGCFSDVILSSASTAVPFAERYYKNPFNTASYGVARPAINDSAAAIVKAAMPKKDKRITVFGRFGSSSSHKNLDGLLAVLPEGLDGYKLALVAGTSNHIEEATVQAMSDALAERGITLELLNMISDTRKFEVIARSDLVLFPSLFEGFGYPPVEAALMGVPCVMYALPVLLENNRDHGYFVPVGDIQAMREKISEVLALPVAQRVPQADPAICTLASIAGFTKSIQDAFAAVPEAKAAQSFDEETFAASHMLYADMIHEPAKHLQYLSKAELLNVIEMYRPKADLIKDAYEVLQARFGYEETELNNAKKDAS